MLIPLLMDKKGYGANHTLLWFSRETLSVKLSFPMWPRRPKNTYTSTKGQLSETIHASDYIIHNCSKKSTVILKRICIVISQELKEIIRCEY